MRPSAVTASSRAGSVYFWAVITNTCWAMRTDASDAALARCRCDASGSASLSSRCRAAVSPEPHARVHGHVDGEHYQQEEQRGTAGCGESCRLSHRWHWWPFALALPNTVNDASSTRDGDYWLRAQAYKEHGFRLAAYASESLLVLCLAFWRVYVNMKSLAACRPRLYSRPSSSTADEMCVPVGGVSFIDYAWVCVCV